MAALPRYPDADARYWIVPTRQGFEVHSHALGFLEICDSRQEARDWIAELEAEDELAASEEATALVQIDTDNAAIDAERADEVAYLDLTMTICDARLAANRKAA